jgi:hypothetical protein
MIQTTNLNLARLEDAIVERLQEHKLLTGRTAAVTSPFEDINELPVPPLVLVTIYGEERRRENNPIGRPVVVKVDVTIHVMIAGTWFRSRGDSLGVHEIMAAIKDQLMGWQPAELTDVKRPLTLENSSNYDHDEERRLLFRLMEWETMILVREPQ